MFYTFWQECAGCAGSLLVLLGFESYFSPFYTFLHGSTPLSTVSHPDPGPPKLAKRCKTVYKGCFSG